MSFSDYIGQLGYTIQEMDSPARENDTDATLLTGSPGLDSLDSYYSPTAEFQWSHQFVTPDATYTYKPSAVETIPKFEINCSSKDSGVPLNPLDRIETYVRNDNSDHHPHPHQQQQQHKLPGNTAINFNTKQSSSPYFSLEDQPKFTETIDVRHISETSLSPHFLDPSIYCFRNNLTTIINNCGVNWLVIAASNTIYVHDINHGLSFVSEINIITTETPTTTVVAESVMPYVPNTINYITYEETENVLLIADDYSRVVVIDVEKFVAVHGHKRYPALEFNNISIDIVTSDAEIVAAGVGYYVNTKSSVWCAKLFQNRLYVSDNSHTVTMFSFHKERADLLGSSEGLDNNIPSIDVALVKSPSGESRVTVACASVHGYVYMLDGDLKVVDCIKLQDSRTWMCKFVSDEAFLAVPTVSELTGDYFMTDEVSKQAVVQSEKLGDVKPSGFGVAANLQHVNVACLVGKDYEIPSMLAFNRTIQLNRRLQFMLNRSSSRQDTYLFVATTRKTGLFNLMLGNLASTDILFPLFADEHSLSPRYTFLNRINLSCDLTRLQCIGVATQAGQVAILRLTEYYGIKGYRVEKMLLDPRQRPGKTIIGLSSTVAGYDNYGTPEYLLLVTFTDLSVHTYKVRGGGASEDGGGGGGSGSGVVDSSNFNIYTVI